MLGLRNKRWIVYSIILVVELALIFGLLMVKNAQAYTVRGNSWRTTNTTFAFDSSFNTAGSRWNAVGTSAFNAWTSSPTPFSFNYNLMSYNIVQAGTLSAGALSSNTNYLDSGGYIAQFAIVINTGYGIPFYDGSQSPSIPSNYYDFGTVMRHELGHTQGLCHSGSISYLMYYKLLTGQQKPLDSDSINGVTYIYGSTPTRPEGSCINGGNL